MSARIKLLRNRALTVSDLIAELSECDEEAMVLFACDYGDQYHTEQALPVESAEPLPWTERIAESAYSLSGLSLVKRREEDRPMTEDESPREVVILRTHRHQ